MSFSAGMPGRALDRAPPAPAPAPAPRFSLIIPAYNEAALLPRLLDSVGVARRHYKGGGPEAIEVIVANNRSSDDTAALARGRGCRVVTVEKRVIAAVRNGGASNSRGEVLAFIDADSVIHPETFNAIDRALAMGTVVAGATGVTLERWSLGIAATFGLIVPLAWISGLDAGVVFCRREDFEAVGGYNEERLFAEDVQFLLDLKRLGRQRGQRLARLTSAKAMTSMRKFDEHGEWHVLRLIASTLYRLLLSRRSINRLARGYWYEVQR